MIPRIASIENLIASDPGGRNIFGLMITDQLRLAAQSLRWAKRVVIVSGFHIPKANAGETDGPPGAKIVGRALEQMGVEVIFVTDAWNERLFRSLGMTPIVMPAEIQHEDSAAGKADVDNAFDVSLRARHEALHTPLWITNFLERVNPSHLLSIERVGRGPDGRYRNMRGVDITETSAPLDELFLEAGRRGLTTIGIGDGGNEIGMGKVFAEALTTIPHGSKIASTVTTDFCIAAGVSNWGAYGLAGALSVLAGRDLLPTSESAAHDIECAVQEGQAVDGITHRREPTVDSLDLSASVRMLESIRRQIASSPLQRSEPLLVAVLGYGETGRATAALLLKNGHQVRISDEGNVMLDRNTVVAGVETGRHSIEFLADCDLVVVSPGVRRDHPILDALHRRGIPVISELELAFQLGDRPLIAVTGTIGKRSTVELMRELFLLAGWEVPIGGNRGRPLSSLLVDDLCARESISRSVSEPWASAHGYMAIAVSSFQLETIVHFRPQIAVLLNIDEAHLDRHRSIAEYVRIKSRIFMNHHPDDSLILNLDDHRVRSLARKHRGRTFFISVQQQTDRGAWMEHGRLHVIIDGAVEEYGDISAAFPHNLLAAVVTVRLAGVSQTQLTEALARRQVERHSVQERSA